MDEDVFWSVFRTEGRGEGATRWDRFICRWLWWLGADGFLDRERPSGCRIINVLQAGRRVVM